MDISPLATVHLDETHRTGDFCCGKSERVQKFIREEAPAFIGQNYSKVFVWPDPEDSCRILGYYTLSANMLAKAELSNRHDRKAMKGLPIPVALVGMMGKADGVQTGLGAALILDAAMRASRIQDLGVWGLTLEPENEKLAVWYASLGFTAAKQRERFMYGPLSAFLPPKE